MNRFFITGIGTGIGKTVVAAILTEALKGDYWKPIQSGSLDATDTMRVKALVTNKTSHFHPERYRLKEYAAPHHAAALENIQMEVADFNLPETDNTLIIEGAGGLMVPLNDHELMTSLMLHLEAPAIIVSKNYLGSINHSLLTIEQLRISNIAIAGIIFNGAPDPSTEEAILNFGNVKMLGRVLEEQQITPAVVTKYAEIFREAILELSNRDELI